MDEVERFAWIPYNVFKLVRNNAKYSTREVKMYHSVTLVKKNCSISHKDGIYNFP